MVTCAYCGTTYKTFQPNCYNCGAALPVPAGAPGATADALPAPPPPPRQLPRNYIWRVLSSNAGGIVGLVFSFLGLVFTFLGVVLTLTLPAEARLVTLIFALLGTIFLIVGIVAVINSVRRARQLAALLRTGEAALGEIVDLYENSMVTINGAHPWRVTYRFSAEGRETEGEAQTLRRPGKAQQPGQPVYVLYKRGAPQHNTIYSDRFRYQ